MLTAVTSGKAAPGVTTSTWALALGWPRPVLVADCDPAGGDMAPGMLAGRLTLDRGLLSWSTAARRDMSVMAAAVLLTGQAVQLPERPQVSFVPGFATATQGASFSTEAWERLAGSLARSAAALGRDALVDTGRLAADRSCWPVLRAADRVLLAVRPSIRSVHAAQEAARRLREQLGDLTTVSALVIGDGPYPANEVAGTLQLPLAAVLPDDRMAAAALSDASQVSAKSLRRSSLVRAATTLAVDLASSAGRPSDAGVAG